MRRLHKRLLVLSLVAGGSWLLSLDPPGEAPSTAFSNERKADYFLRHFEIVSMDLQGRPQRTLQAEQMEHFPLDDSTDLKKPVLHIHSAESPAWKVISKTGHMDSDGEQLTLNGPVRLHRPAAPGFQAITVDTHNVRVQLDKDLAETREAVDIKTGIHKMNGIGMKAIFRDPIQVRLLAKVGGIHAVQ